MATIPQVITPLPTPPSTSDPANFDVRADAFLGALPGMVTQINSNNNTSFNNAVEGANSAIAANNSKTAAETAATNANASKTAAETAATNANASKTAAETANADIQKYYLGRKSSPPTVDNQGNPLQAGAWYTNTNGTWYWWNGSWVPGVGDIAGSYLPLSGGNMLGPVTVPAGATGNQVPRISEVFKKTPEAFGKAKPMGELDVGYALFTTTAGRGGDWPPEAYDDPNQAWLVETTGGVGRAKQIATQLLATTSGRIQNSTWQRSLEGTTWGAWDRVITARTAMDQQVTANVPSGAGSYLVDPGMGGSHVVTINGSCTFNLPIGRQYGDQVTLDVISAGAIRSIGFSANVVLPKDGTGANLPFPTYPTDGVVSFVFRYILANRWECYYAGVH